MLPGAGDAQTEPGNVLPLRMLLSAATGLLFASTTVLLLWRLAVGSPDRAAGLFLLVLLLGGSGAVLFVRDDLTVSRLRIVERVVWGAFALYLAITAQLTFADTLVSGNMEEAAARWSFTVAQFLLLMVAYGALVPNRWPRAARVLGGMALLPVAAALALPFLRPAVSPVLGEFLTPGRIGESLALLLLGFGLATLTAHVIDQYLGTAVSTRVTLRYHLRERIGIGGMGEVWRGEHALLARTAAVKLIRPDQIGDGDSARADLLMRRFEREARATARLRSAHTVEVYDFGVAQDGTFYYAMEYLDGIDLQSLVERHGAVPAERVAYILRQACDSLIDAHDHGMTHRDIKPANIFICRLGPAHDFVKVLDFGLVKVARHSLADSAGTTPITAEGTMSGTPAYMAPELIFERPDVDGRADLYALGCVAYYMLAGVPPFDGPPMAVLVDHVKTEPAPPSTKTDVPIPAELERIVMKCLAKDPADRYQTARELADDLERCTHESPWSARRAAEWWALHLPAAA